MFNEKNKSHKESNSLISNEIWATRKQYRNSGIVYVQYIFGKNDFSEILDYQRVEIIFELHLRCKIRKKPFKLTGMKDRIVRELVI